MLINMLPPGSRIIFANLNVHAWQMANASSKEVGKGRLLMIPTARLCWAVRQVCVRACMQVLLDVMFSAMMGSKKIVQQQRIHLAGKRHAMAEDKDRVMLDGVVSKLVPIFMRDPDYMKEDPEELVKLLEEDVEGVTAMHINTAVSESVMWWYAML
jgi:hypothetical protein